jgi:hypothetical protein
MLECLEAREVPSASTGDAPPPNLGANSIQQNQSSQMQVNYDAVFTNRQSTIPVSLNGTGTSNLQQELKKSLITKGTQSLRNGPVGAEPKTQRQLEREALDRMLALSVTRPPADGIQPHEIRPRFLTGAETGERPATPPKGWQKIEVFGPPKGNSTIAEKIGTFYKDPASGRMIRWS